MSIQKKLEQVTFMAYLEAIVIGVLLWIVVHDLA